MSESGDDIQFKKYFCDLKRIFIVITKGYMKRLITVNVQVYLVIDKFIITTFVNISSILIGKILLIPIRQILFHIKISLNFNSNPFS